MKAKATVTLDLENKKIVDISFDRRILNKSTGVGQIKAFIRRKVLNTPIQNFKPFNERFYQMSMVLDVYPIVKKMDSAVLRFPYSCKLHPLPRTNETSDITLEEFEAMWRNSKRREVI